MATAATLDANIVSWLATLATSESITLTRYASDYLLTESITAGEHRYQIRIYAVGLTRDSNEGYQVVQADVAIHHRLSDPDVDRPSSIGALQGLTAALTDPLQWRDLAAVHEVLPLGAPSVEIDPPSRVGNVITFTVGAQVALAP